MAHVNVVGWYGHGNVGDESYKICFPKVFPGHSFSFSADGSGSGPAVLGGGNVCSKSFLDQMDRFSGRKFAVSVGCTRDDPAARLMGFDGVFVRDEESVENLRRAGVAARLAPDLAFCLEPDRAAGRAELERRFEGQGRDLYEKVVAVILNAYLCVGDDVLAREEANFQKVVWDLARTMDSTNASFVFLPFGTGQPHDDRIANSWLAGKCKYWKKNLVVYDAPGVQRTLDLLSACDCAISTRLHSSIFSAVACVPFIDVTHHSKNSGFLRSIYRKDWSVPYWDFDRAQFVGMLNGLLGGGAGHGLAEIVAEKRIILGGLCQDVHFV
jgi:polysaccharide pyruvyl transferase WcaK-like protein